MNAVEAGGKEGPIRALGKLECVTSSRLIAWVRFSQERGLGMGISPSVSAKGDERCEHTNSTIDITIENGGLAILLPIRCCFRVVRVSAWILMISVLIQLVHGFRSVRGTRCGRWRSRSCIFSRRCICASILVSDGCDAGVDRFLRGARRDQHRRLLQHAQERGLRMAAAGWDHRAGFGPDDLASLAEPIAVGCGHAGGHEHDHHGEWRG